ncbi:hypothetical protein [Ensifer sp. SSB1]|jgi:hypothetical protein|uniref:hypothetical protein n=1 Tax=Ensifer sp. SSB1 TaxID=2795385 RepID=UPI001A534742|nr:hypothetical protein [Ensifer sp. SSB1]MBK5571435.1 hypothetical protein [Ensifer sp. SSB1]
MAIHKKRLMKSSEIPEFVNEVIAAGCDIKAIGHDIYVLGGMDEEDAEIDALDLIGEKFGNRDTIVLEIVAYLRSLGRFVDPTWAETRH